MKNLYIQANHQIHPSETVKSLTIEKMNRQKDNKFYFSSKMAMTFASLCLCVGASAAMLHSMNQQKTGSDNAQIMLANELESVPQTYSISNELVHPDMILDYKLVMESNNEDGSTTLTYQNDSKVIDVLIIALDSELVSSYKDNHVTVETADTLLAFESSQCTKEELIKFAEYFK